MIKLYLILFIFFYCCINTISAQKRIYVAKDSISIKKVIIKWAPLALLDIKPNIALSAEFPLKNKKTVNIQLGYILFDDRFYESDLQGEVYDYSSRLNYNLPNFILKTDYRWAKKSWYKRKKYVRRYNAVRVEYHLTNYIGEFKTCTEWKEVPPLVPAFVLFRNFDCVATEKFRYKAQSHQFGLYYLWGKEIIYRSNLVFDFYTGPGFRIDYTKAPEKTYGIPDPGDTLYFNLDLNPYHLSNFENQVKFLPNWAAGLRIGYSF